uniref:sensor histidine kinase n=1 Tax=Pedobacter schmidteae TaxID=2201271 RepID=UPI000EB078F0|nr:HAMP domain-containing sensor histidine kinase [Pedobacter schmidteae]
MFKRLLVKWQDNWLRMVGDADHFSLEGRIFHTISITAIAAVSIITIYNFSTSLYFAALISAAILIIQTGLYALSRYMYKSRLAVILSVIQINVAIALAYFYNSGISGSILLLFMVSLYLIFLIIPRKKLAFWYFFNVVLVLTVLAIEYFYPKSIQQYYSGRGEWFMDVAFTYVMVSVMIAVGTIQLRKSYRTQKERAEDKALKLELMNKEKDKLFSIIGHDLNTPLNSLQLYLQLLNEMELNAEERLSVEQNLTKSLSDAQYLLGNLLEWAKNQLQNVPMCLVPVSVEAQLLPTIRMFEPLTSRKNIKVLVEIDKEVSISADKNMFDLVMRNLLNNAVKFTNPGGTIQVGTTLEDGKCIISIKDDGIGIASERQAEIFSLNIASSYGTMNEKGTGLGLVLCKDFIVQQGGRIWFTSSVDTGTVFYVEMSLA